MGRPRRARLPGAPCPGRVAAGRRPAPSRHAGSMPRPTRHTCGAGTSDPGGASGPRPACRGVPSRAPSPPLVGVPRPTRRVPVCAPTATRRRGAKTAPAPGKASHHGKAGGAWARGAMAVAQAAMACKVPRRGATRACTRRALGGRTPASVVRATARLDGCAAGREDVGSAPVVGAAEARKRGTPRALRRV